jgi:hypothetical protein
MPGPELPQVVLLQKQIHRLGELADVSRGALEVTQDGSVLHISALHFKLSIDAQGKTIGTVQYTSQE